MSMTTTICVCLLLIMKQMVNVELRFEHMLLKYELSETSMGLCRIMLVKGQKYIIFFGSECEVSTGERIP